MKIILTGGGSGGHLMPIIATIRELKRLGKNDLVYIGPKSNYDYLFQQEGVEMIKIFSGKLRRYFTFEAILQNLIDIFIFFPLGFVQSLYYLNNIKDIKCIFSKGGHGAFLPSLAAIFLNIPLILHESDAVIGKSNSIFASFAKKVFLSFPKDSLQPNEEIIGNPVREELFSMDVTKAKELLNIKTSKPVIFIFGGSLGSQRINNLILPNLNDLLTRFEIIHMCGSLNCQKISSSCQSKIKPDLCQSYHIFGFLDEKHLAAAFATSDIIIARAGAGSIFEIAHANKPGILIPLKESAQNHQLFNARAYEKSGSCFVIEEDEISFDKLILIIDKIMATPGLIQRMTENTKTFSSNFAQKRLAKYLLDLH